MKTHNPTSPSVIQAAIFLSMLIQTTMTTRADYDYKMVDLADPLQPVWDRLDSLPEAIIEPLKRELQAGLIRVENNLERKMRSLISGITSRISALESRVVSGGGGRGQGGGGEGGGGGGGAAVLGANLNQTLYSLFQGFYVSRMQVDHDEATLKIENHINDQINQLEERIKINLDDKLEESLTTLAAVTRSTQGEISNNITPDAASNTRTPATSNTLNVPLMMRLDSLIRNINSNNATLQTINLHAAKIVEKLDEGDTCGTLVDKVSELMAIPNPGSGSPSSSSTCGGLTAQNLSELRTALDRIRETPTFLPRDCSDHHWQHPEAPSGVFNTFPDMDPKRSYPVYCDMGQTTAKETGGWTVIIKRQNTTWDLTNFNRTWAEYRAGFGSPGEGEWFYGLSPLHALTYRQPYELRVYMHDVEKGYFQANYNTFRLEDESQNYSLIVDGFSGNVSMDALAAKHHGSPFSTLDRDNDLWEGNCAVSNGGGWWYNRCHYTTLTAPFPTSADRNAKTIRWRTDDDWLVFDDVTVMIRPTGYSQRFDTKTST